MTTPSPAPVFVDPSGRRARWAHAGFLVVAAVALLYVVTVALSLVLPPGALHLSVPGLGPVLPGPAPVGVSAGNGTPTGKLAVLIPTASPHEVGASPIDLATQDPTRPTAGPGSGPTLTPSPALAPTPTASPTSQPTPVGSTAASSHPTPHATVTRGVGRSKSPSPRPTHPHP